MRPHREVRVWKRKKVEVEARILRLEALKEQTRIWMKKASEKRLELGWKSSTYQQLVELHSQRLPQVIEETAVKLSQAQLEKIAKEKMTDLNTTKLESAMRSVAGTARSMGVEVER